MTVLLLFQYHEVAVLGSHHHFKLFNSHVEEAHDEQSYSQTVCHQNTVLRKVFLCKVSIKTPQQIVHTVIDIRPSLASRYAVVEWTLFPSFPAYLVKLLVTSQIPPLLLSQAWFLVIVKLVSRKGRDQALEC